MIKGTDLGNVLIVFNEFQGDKRFKTSDRYKFFITKEGWLITDVSDDTAFTQGFIERYLKKHYKEGKTLSVKLLEKLFFSNLNCQDCIDCVGCFNCSRCKSCTDCAYCIDCFMCKNCYRCDRCRGCETCTSCKDCKECFNSTLVTHSCDLHECSNCDKCNSLMTCKNCKRCNYSKNLENCQNLSKVENKKNNG